MKKNNLLNIYIFSLLNNNNNIGDNINININNNNNNNNNKRRIIKIIIQFVLINKVIMI
jgi:hypothetical protein